jgi:hypothetical protein
MRENDDFQRGFEARERLLDEAEQRERIVMRRYRIAFAVILTFVGVYVSFWSFFGSRININDALPQSLKNVSSELSEMKNEFKKASSEILVIQSTLSELRGKSTSTTLNPADLQRLNTVLEEQHVLDNRLKVLENAISTDPAKALSVPLLRKDIDELQTTQNNSALILNAEVTRLYNFVLGFFGLIITVSITFLGLTFAGMREARKMPTHRPDEPKAI